MHPPFRSLYSWRDDSAVPAFDDARILLVMDGDCALCSAGARRIARLDRDDTVRIATVASPLGAALLAHYDLTGDDPETWLMLADGKALGGLDAMMVLLPKLSRWYAPMRMLRVLPQALRDWIYARIARNRYSVFGRGDMCALPDPDLRRRLVS